MFKKQARKMNEVSSNACNVVANRMKGFVNRGVASCMSKMLNKTQRDRLILQPF